MQKLTIGYSPCPNDTFIFDAMIHGKIDTEGLEFEVKLADVEELNQGALRGDLDITKLSYHAYAHLYERYILLRAGSALGNNCGPLLVAARPFEKEEVEDAKIAIPGRYTTANFLMSYAFPKANQREEILFSEIEKLVLNGTVDLGVIIHENRFTYHERGLHKVMDLGEHWEQSTGLPIPLGGIVVKRSLDDELQQKIDRVLRRSVEFALNHPAESMGYVSLHAQEMDPRVMQQHIQLYVNDYTVDFGAKGEAAIKKLFATVHQGKSEDLEMPLWLESGENG
jgi:1,4-dihydroxy-6-naphthoate synthase